MLAVWDSQKGKKDYAQVVEYNENSSELLPKLYEMCKNKEYRTKDYINFTISERGKVREISKLNYYPHRIYQRCIIDVTRPIMVGKLIPYTYAALKGRGMHQALYDLRGWLLKDPVNTQWCLKIDISKYFPHVDHTKLKSVLRELFGDTELLAAFDEIIDSHDVGIPIGNYTSQYFANVYLYKFDRWCHDNVVYYSRYMDDMVFLARDRYSLLQLYRDISWRLMRDYGLSVKDNWQIFNVDERGVDYVGYRIFRNRVLLRNQLYRNMLSVTNQVRKMYKKRGYVTERERCQLGSYFGWILRCTPKVRHELYKKHFSDIFIPTKEKQLRLCGLK